MSLFKTLHGLYSRTTTTKTLSHLSSFIRNLTNPPQTNNNSLHLLFQEAVGSLETPQKTLSQTESDELKKGLREIEEEVRHLKANPNNQENVNENANSKETNKGKKMGLYSLFLDKKRRQEEVKRARREEEEPMVFKELSPDMKLLLSHLYQKGYFKKANFLPDDSRKLDLSCFNDSYSRGFIKFAAERFGKDNQEIGKSFANGMESMEKWLSGSDLKKVALFGCPSLSKKNVFSAKQLRNFFEIQEDTVCSKCVLRHSCDYVNRSVWKGGNKNLKLADVMRVITLYAMESMPLELQVPEDVRASISQLLKEVINLSETTSKAALTSTN